MLSDNWEIAHIALVVDDLEAAMAHYAKALGFAWSPVIELPSELETKSDVFEGGVSHDGMRAVLSLSGSSAVGGDTLFAPLELACAKPGTPAHAMWGCPDGNHFIHHIAYWVDDIDAESAHLRSQGLEREWYVERDGHLDMVYHRAKGGMRFELQDAAKKPRQAAFIATALQGG